MSSPSRRALRDSVTRALAARRASSRAADGPQAGPDELAKRDRDGGKAVGNAGKHAGDAEGKRPRKGPPEQVEAAADDGKEDDEGASAYRMLTEQSHRPREPA